MTPVKGSSSKYLSKDFTDKAPLDEGVENLAGWLQAHLGAEVIQNARQEGARSMGVDAGRPEAQNNVEPVVRLEAEVRMDTLLAYAGIVKEIYLARATGNKAEVAQLERGRDGIAEIALGLELVQEQAILDDLFKKAADRGGKSG
jgi:hypothetical protein